MGGMSTSPSHGWFMALFYPHDWLNNGIIHPCIVYRPIFSYDFPTLLFNGLFYLHYCILSPHISHDFAMIFPWFYYDCKPVTNHWTKPRVHLSGRIGTSFMGPPVGPPGPVHFHCRFQCWHSLEKRRKKQVGSLGEIWKFRGTDFKSCLMVQPMSFWSCHLFYNRLWWNRSKVAVATMNGKRQSFSPQSKTQCQPERRLSPRLIGWVWFGKIHQK